jgi:hypothetical protein
LQRWLCRGSRSREGVKFYDSSGNTFAGNYYLASVSFELADGSVVSTPPIKVLGITSAYCAKGYPECEKNPPTPTLHYVGVDRNSTTTDDTFDSPADNAFLQVAAGGSGTVSPGYILTGTTITLGITSTEGFGLDPLAPSTTVSGDWNSAAGCFTFPRLSVAEPVLRQLPARRRHHRDVRRSRARAATDGRGELPVLQAPARRRRSASCRTA